ncbi:MAG: hypothetical protein ACM3US_07365 [Sphingomonadaceae bacterium]
MEAIRLGVAAGQLAAGLVLRCRRRGMVVLRRGRPRPPGLEQRAGRVARAPVEPISPDWLHLELDPECVARVHGIDHTAGLMARVDGRGRYRLAEMLAWPSLDWRAMTVAWPRN